MVIAALVCFTILLVAWAIAPDHPRAATPLAAAPDVEPKLDPTPLLEVA